jgi:hypothetical protein
VVAERLAVSAGFGQFAVAVHSVGFEQLAVLHLFGPEWLTDILLAGLLVAGRILTEK